MPPKERVQTRGEFCAADEEALVVTEPRPIYIFSTRLATYMAAAMLAQEKLFTIAHVDVQLDVCGEGPRSLLQDGETGNITRGGELSCCVSVRTWQFC